MRYRNYSIEPKYSEHQTYYGEIKGLPEAKMVEAPTIDDFELLFHQAVDDALDEVEQKRHKRSRKLTIWGVVLVGIIFVLAATLPGKDKHVQVVSKAVSVAIDAKAEQMGFDLSWLGAGTTANICRKALDEYVRVDNYLIFNIAYVTISGDSQPISVGILNQVITAPPKMMEKYLDDAITSATESVDSFLDMLF